MGVEGVDREGEPVELAPLAEALREGLVDWEGEELVE